MNETAATEFWRVVVWNVDTPESRRHTGRPLTRRKAELELESVLRDQQLRGDLDPVDEKNAAQFGIFMRDDGERFPVPLGSGQDILETETVYKSRFDGNFFTSKSDAEKHISKLRKIERGEGQ